MSACPIDLTPKTPSIAITTQYPFVKASNGFPRTASSGFQRTPPSTPVSTSPTGSMSDVPSIHSTASSGQLLGNSAANITPPSTGRRVRVPTTVHMSRLPPKVRIQLLKSQLQPLSWQNKQICDHFITGNCPYVPCRFAHQCLLCMDDLIGACSVAQCKYVHLLSTPDAECTDDRVIIVRRGQLLPPQPSMPSQGASFVGQVPIFGVPPVQGSAHVSAPTAMGASVSADSLDAPFFSAAQPYPRLTQGHGAASAYPKLGHAETHGSGDVYHGHYPSPTGSPYPAATYSPVPSSPEAESAEHRYVYPTVASDRSTPSPQSPVAPAVQYTQYGIPPQHTGYPVLGCQLPCCAGRRSSYPVVPAPSAPMAPQQQLPVVAQNVVPPPPPAYAQTVPVQTGSYQHSPYTIPTIPYYSQYDDAATSASSASYSAPPQPAFHNSVCACPACARGYEASSSYPSVVYSEVKPSSDFPPSPSSSSSGSSGSSNPWISQRPPPVPSPRHFPRGTRRTSDTSQTYSSSE